RARGGAAKRYLLGAAGDDGAEGEAVDKLRAGENRGADRRAAEDFLIAAADPRAAIDAAGGNILGAAGPGNRAGGVSAQREGEGVGGEVGGGRSAAGEDGFLAADDRAADGGAPGADRFDAAVREGRGGRDPAGKHRERAAA